MKNIETIDMANKTELAKILARQKWCDGCALISCGTKECADYIRTWMDEECEVEENPPADEPQQEAHTEKNPDKTMINNPPADEVDLQKDIQDIYKEYKEKHSNDWYTMVDEASKKIDQLIYSAKSDNKAKKSQQKTHDNVNHPAHYTFGNIETIDFIEDKKLGFHLGNAVKYISRAGRKDPARTIEDLRKAAWYLNRQIERLEGSLGGQNG